MTEKQNTPEIRFEGFTDPWEQRKLGEIATRHDNLRIPVTAKDRTPGDTPYYGANGIQDYVEGYTHEGEFVLVAEDGATDLDNYPVQLISGLSWVNNHAHVIKAIPDVAQNRFIMHLIKSMDIASCLVGGTRSKLNAEVLMGIELKLPSNSEQIYIGALLSTLDSLITLHQRKYDKLCTVKKSMLGKMFPKPGETEPEIRFDGFTDPWEQRKLGEFGKKRTIKNADGTLSETFTNSAEQGVISQLDYFDHDITNDANISGYYVVQPDDFVYNPRISATAPCGPINRNRLNRAGVMSPLYTVFSVDASVDKTYLEHYFKTSRWHDFMFLEGNSGARSDRFSISDATFFEMPIWCPEISEQKAIAKQLETADRLITLHQREPRFADIG